ncbi:MAG TPA: hydrogenase/urease maturation nickel metallochaperone HypA [Nitrososphaerales archaeon]|nr:hydrogenase/urease maturation nickel metallochaperone HypA [Nitrososphaerales archaeon]
MHELSIAQSIIDYAVSEADRNKAEAVSEIQVDVGELMQVDVKAMRELIKLLMKGPRLEHCKVRLRIVEARFQCRKCGFGWAMSEAKKQLQQTTDSLLVREPDSKELPLHFLPSLYSSFIRCPRCGSADFGANSGEDIRLRKLVLG